MALVRLFLLLALFGPPARCAGQDEEKKPPRRGSEDSVQLDKLRLPSNGTVVVTPDLKKALDALGADSVVLSAERYQQLMSRLNAQGADKAGSEILFGAFRIEGEVKSAPGRETAELTFDLEFRTDAPNTTVSIPFKGVRFSSATLNGAPPVWGPDPERLSVLVKEPQACKLRLTASVPVTRVGNERRLTLDKVPAAAVTSLDLTVPGTVTQAAVLGAGLIPINRGPTGTTRLQSSALGILAGLDLTWQLGDAAAPSQATIEGDIRITLEESAAQVEAKLRPLPFAPLKLPWKVRLPAGITQLRAELLRTEALGSEPLIMTRGADGTFTITSPYPTATFDYTQILLRWKQPLVDADGKAKVVLGSCEVVEPAGRQQTGVLTLVAAEEPTVMLRPVNVAALERNPADRDKHGARYRYTQQPAGLNVLPLPPALTRGAVEFNVLHTLSIQDGSWLLTTDLDITRAARAQLTSLELAWPADWQVSRRVLFSPVVKDLVQDTKTQRLRIILDGKPPAAFSVRLESTPTTNPASILLNVPQVVAAQGVVGQRAVPVELVPLQEKVKLDVRTWDVRNDPATTGLREEAGSESSQLAVTTHPAVLAVTREPRLPKYRCRLEAFLTHQVVQTRQAFEVRWNGPAPRRLSLLVPSGLHAVQFLRQVPGTQKTEPLIATARRDENPGAWQSWTLEVPADASGSLQLLCLLDAAAANPMTVPVVRFDEGQALLDGNVEAQCTAADLSLNVPQIAGWRTVSERPGRVELLGESLDQLLALELTPGIPESVIPARIREGRVVVQAEASTLTAQYHWSLDDLRITELPLEVSAPARDVVVLDWALEDQSQPVEQLLRTAVEDKTVIRIPIPPRRLGQSLNLKITLQFPAPRSQFMLAVPAVQWTWLTSSVLEAPRSWRVASEPGWWLLFANQQLDATHHTGSSWLPVSPGRGGSAGYLAFRDVDADGALRLVLAPRLAVLLVLSVLAFAACRFLAGRPTWVQRVAYGTPILLVLLHLAAPHLAAALLLGMLPGVAAALATHGGERWLRTRRSRRPVVFQRGPAPPGTSIPPSTRSVVMAEAATLIPDTHHSAR